MAYLTINKSMVNHNDYICIDCDMFEPDKNPEHNVGTCRITGDYVFKQSGACKLIKLKRQNENKN